jgi:hypothetical protein
MLRIACFFAICLPVVVRAADDSKSDPRYPFRTDFANANLLWYKPVVGEFPPHHSDRRIGGELVTADFIHRRGQFRTSKTGELVDFTMPPYGSVMYLNSEADLRDVPLGTYLLFFLNQDDAGQFTKLATMEDQFTMDASHGFSYRLDEIEIEQGRLRLTKQSVPKKQPNVGKLDLSVTPETRAWKNGAQIKLTDLAVGDDLLFNLTGKSGQYAGGVCTDLWVGAQTHKQTTESVRKKFADFVKARGLPGWIDKVDGNNLTVTFFSGDAPAFKQTFLGEFAKDKELRVCVANDELRTWNPPVDGERANLLDVQTGPVNAYGTSGVHVICDVKYMLEGFRKGRVVRVFGGGWARKDPPCGEGLMNYGYRGVNTPELTELPPKEYPTQFPFRTDYGNESLSWYQLKPNQAPPPFSAHAVLGELVRVNADGRSGQFRTDRTGELVEFTLLPSEAGGAVKYLNARATLSDIPSSMRCRFNLYQDDHGAFTRAGLISDEFSYLAGNTLTYRIEALKLSGGKIHVARQMGLVKNYNGDMEQPPDIGQAELLVSPDTRVWKGDRQLRLAELAVGDLLLVNLTGEQSGTPSRCTDIYVGAETHQLVSDWQSHQHPSAVNAKKR